MHGGKIGKERSKETFRINDNIIGPKKRIWHELRLVWFGTSCTWTKGQDGVVIWLFCHRNLVIYDDNQRRYDTIKRWFCAAILYTIVWKWTVFNILQNQSGIYYDVDFEQDVYSGTSKSQPAAIPMSTYTMSSRAPYYRQWSLQHPVLYQTPNRTGRMNLKFASLCIIIKFK